MIELRNFHLKQDDQGILTATLDVPERPLNVFDDSVLRELHEVVQFVRNNARNLKMVVFRSGKPAGFLAGADIHRLQSIESAADCEWILEQGQRLFNEIESLPVPTLALVHGACVGGGLEFILSCTYRLAVDEPSTRLGLPEVKLGLIPAWGGTQRLPKRVGLFTALPMLLEGRLLNAQDAEKSGLVQGLVRKDHLESDLQQFIARRLKGEPLRKLPRSWLRWAIDSNAVGQSLAMNRARLKTKSLARHYPALARIIETTELGLRHSKVSQAGLTAERNAFAELLLGDVSPHLIDLFLLQERAKKTSTWTQGTEPLPVQRVLVLGAGTMGAGIAQLAAAKGYSVILQDIQEEYVNKGMETIRSLFHKATSKGAIPRLEAEQAAARVQSRIDWNPGSDVDLMIEAIVERLDIKQAAFQKADELLPLHAVLASNTSALPVGSMAAATHRPEKVGGLHFFNPVHKMPLVEVVRAPQTSDQTIATLVNVARKLGKVPIVVRQSPGFLVNRILFPYLDEAARLVCEGFEVQDIDREAKKFGMPMGPLELLDVVGIDVALDVSKTLSPLARQATPSPALFERMVQAGHKGQKTGQGFYPWNEGKRLQSATSDLAGEPTGRVILPDWEIHNEVLGTIQQRLALAMINESQKCLDEQVVSEAWMVDLGMVLGTGFAPFRGGPMSCLETWSTSAVRERLKILEQTCGARFTPATGLEQDSFSIQPAEIESTQNIQTS